MDKKKLDLKEIGVKRLAIIALCGILLLALSVPDLFKKGQDGKTAAPVSESPSPGVRTQSQEEYARQMEEKLEKLLAKVDGIGAVDVMLTLRSSKEQVTLRDEPTNQSSAKETDSTGGSRITASLERGDETVLVKSREGESVPYVVKELEPQVEGVVVIAQGGGDAGIINEINSAIEVLFGIPAHKIKVMKMVDKGMNPG